MVIGLSGRLLGNCFTWSECASRELDSNDPTKRLRADREWRHMCKTWGSLLETADPLHNPNLLFHWDYQEIPSSPRRRKPWHYIVEEVLNLNRYFPLMNDAFKQLNDHT